MHLPHPVLRLPHSRRVPEARPNVAVTLRARCHKSALTGSPLAVTNWDRATISVVAEHNHSFSQPMMVLEVHALGNVRKRVSIPFFAFDTRPAVMTLLDLLDSVLYLRPGTRARHVFGLVVPAELFEEPDADRQIAELTQAFSALHQRLGLSCPRFGS